MNICVSDQPQVWAIGVVCEMQEAMMLELTAIGLRRKILGISYRAGYEVVPYVHKCLLGVSMMPVRLYRER